MASPSIPILIVPALELAGNPKVATTAKGLTSSIFRSLFSGSVILFRNSQMPLFKVERKHLDEEFVQKAISGKTDADWRCATRELLFNLCDHLKPEPRQWVIVVDSAGLALRNVDHLIPPELPGPYAPPEIDFLWTRNSGTIGNETAAASPGLWAVRGEHLPLVLARWREAWTSRSGGGAEAMIWSEVVSALPLKKRAFEKGEVICPDVNAVDWQAVNSAAFVTVPDWPQDERWKFLQALYFGTYFGDETGMMLNVLDA